jgi:hypothetical protein
MLSSGMIHHATLVRTDVSDERSTSIIRVIRIGELGTTLTVTSNRRTLRRDIMYVFLRSVRQLLVTVNVVPISSIPVTLMIEVLRSSETSVLQQPHGVTSQKTAFFIVTTVKTSNLTSKKTCFPERLPFW